MPCDNGILGSISIFAGIYAPKDWAECKGQLLSIPGNEALFSLIGTKFGGDGRNTFALPNLSGRLPIGHDNKSYRIGDSYDGTMKITPSALPPHTHTLQATNSLGDEVCGEEMLLAQAQSTNETMLYTPYNTVDSVETTNDSSFVKLAPEAISTEGFNVTIPAKDHFPPVLSLRFCICLKGIYPSRE